MKKVIYLILINILLSSCMDLSEVNINPNGVPEEEANPNLLMSTVLSKTSKLYLNNGFIRMAGTMQYIQEVHHTSEINNYKWKSEEWSEYYSLLRNNKKVYEIAERDNLEFHKGVALVMKSFLFGQVADFWGDAPYSQALKADLEENAAILLPEFDSQEVIYKGIISDLQEAEILLSKSKNEYKNIYDEADLYYQGDPEKWLKFANSLQLRYYMRLSEKLPEFAEQGIHNIVNNNKLIFESVEDDADMGFVGSLGSDSWPTTAEFDPDSIYFNQKQMCSTFVEKLRQLNDSRLSVWADPIKVPTVLDAEHKYSIKDTISEGVRYLWPEEFDLEMINTNSDYVGIPPSLQVSYTYNYNTDSKAPIGHNLFVSHLNIMYSGADGELLKARLMTYSEVNFILAEAAQRGWISNGENYYNLAVEASFTTWGRSGDYSDYISQPEVAFDASLERIIEQKWISLWSSAQESWFDYRRTGFPVLQAGPYAQRNVLPLRFVYGQNEVEANNENYQKALLNLVLTAESEGETDSPWSKMWLLQ
ncbi:MAG: SusD/RagB family nutrient-binding outer membrane lipoprotein [Bacteroidota bacterium]